MIRSHDFINGDHYLDPFTGETMSVEAYYQKELEEENQKKAQQYILIERCESIINQTNFYCDTYLWYYQVHEDFPTAPENVIVLSNQEYIKIERNGLYYRAYTGDHYLTLKLAENKKLPFDKIQEIHGFFVAIIKGRGTLYTKEQIREIIL